MYVYLCHRLINIHVRNYAQITKIVQINHLIRLGILRYLGNLLPSNDAQKPV